MKSYKPNRCTDHTAEYQAGFVRWFSANKARFKVPVEMSGVTNPPPDCTERRIRLTFPTLPNCLQIEMIIGPGRQFVVDAAVEWNCSKVYLQDFEELFLQRGAWGSTCQVKSLNLIREPLLRWVNEALAPAIAIRLRSDGGYTRLGWSATLVHGTVAVQPTDLYDIPLKAQSVKYMTAKRRYPIPHELIVAFQCAKHVLILTGAGISAESGNSISKNAIAGQMEQLEVLNFAEPNPAHFAIEQLAHLCPQLTLVTQNLDDLHERAGSANVLHLSGDLQEQAFQSAIAAAKSCDVLLAVDTSGLDSRTAMIASLAVDAGAFVAQMTTQQAGDLPMAHQCLSGLAGTLLPLLVQAAFPNAIMG